MTKKVFEAGCAVAVVFREGDDFRVGMTVYRNGKEVTILTPHELWCLRSALGEADEYIRREASFIDPRKLRRSI